MGDFTGFTFGGIHSDELGIIRVSGGDMYDETLHPDIEDRISEVPGLNGVYYFGSEYKAKKIEISIAFDSLTEDKFRKLRQVFGTKKVKDLIFDERPYKKYLAKIESPVELSFVCFDEPAMIETTIDGIRYKTGDEEYSTSHIVERPTGGKRRIYKGEGKIDFVCYFPFAKSVYKTLPFSYQKTTDTEIQEGKKYYKIENEEYVLVSNPDVSEINDYYETVTNKESEEWAFSSGLLTYDEYTGNFDTYENQQFKVYNPGDVSTGFRLYIPVGDIPVVTPGSDPENITFVYKKNGTDVIGTLVIKPMELDELEIGIIIDTDNQTITGVRTISGSDITLSGKLYNEYVVAGFFFRLEPDDTETKTGSTIEISEDLSNAQISYNYLYL